MTHIRVQQQEFWDDRAKIFPRYSEGENTYEAGMLKIAKDHGVDFRGAKVLDIGCGSGMYTIRIAKEAHSVTATDISSEMLRILKEDAEANGVNNITPVLSDWADFQTDEKFDIVFCSMTPAIQTEGMRQKICDSSRRWAVYMGFAGRTPSNIQQVLYDHYGVTQKKFTDAMVMREWLDEKSIPYKSYPVEGEWVRTGSYEDTARSVRSMLDAHNVKAEEDILRKHIEPFRNKDGQYTEISPYKIEMIIWEN